MQMCSLDNNHYEYSATSVVTFFLFKSISVNEKQRPVAARRKCFVVLQRNNVNIFEP